MKISVPVFILITFGFASDAPCVEFPKSDFDSDTWEYMTLPFADEALYPSIEINSNGYPCIAFVLGGVQYAEFDGSTWEWEMIDTSSTIPYLAFGSDGLPRIAAESTQNQQVMLYTKQPDQTWDSSVVYDYSSAPGNVWTENICLILDSDDNPHVSFYLTYYDKTIYTCYADSIWEVQLEIDEAQNPDLAIDMDDNPRLAYSSNSAITTTFYEQGQWWTQIIGSSSTTIFYPKIRITSDGYSHVVCKGNYMLTHSWDAGPGWQSETVFDEYNPLIGDMEIGASDQIYVSFTIYPYYDLFFAKYDGNQWEAFNIDWEESNGHYSSLALGDSESCFISYNEYINTASKSESLLKLIWHGPFTGIEDDASVSVSDYGIAVSPNPAVNNVLIECLVPLDCPVELHLYDSSGRLVREYSGISETGSYSRNVNGLSPGMYFAHIQSDAFADSQKFLILE